MTQTQLPNTEPAGPRERRTDRDLQRAALGDLVTLSAECTVIERRVEQDHLVAVQGEDRRHQKVVADLDERYKSDTANARLRHTERVAAARGQFDQDFAALKLWDQVGRDKADAEHNTAEKGVKEKLQQATWLAESVFEAATISVRDELRKSKEKVARQREALAAIDKKAAELLVLYGVAKSAKVPSGGGGADATTVDVAP